MPLEREDEFGTKEKSINTAPFWIGFTSNFNAIARIDPAKGVDPFRRDVTADPGWSFTARVVGSTLANPYQVIAGAIGSLSGPLHGGANEEVLVQLEEIGGAANVKKWLDDGVFYLVSPLDSANMTEVELTEEQEMLLNWLDKNQVEHVRVKE